MEFLNWNVVEVRPEFYLPRRNVRCRPSRWYQRAIAQFKAQTGSESLRYYFNVEGYFKNHFLMALYTRDIADLQRRARYRIMPRTDEGVADVRSCPPDRRRGTRNGRTGENFVREVLNLLWIRLERRCTGRITRPILRAKYRRRSRRLNKNYGSGLPGVSMRSRCPGKGVQDGLARQRLGRLYQGLAPIPRPGTLAPGRGLEHLRHRLARLALFREYLQMRYGTIEQFNRRIGAPRYPRLHGDSAPPQHARALPVRSSRIAKTHPQRVHVPAQLHHRSRVHGAARPRYLEYRDLLRARRAGGADRQSRWPRMRFSRFTLPNTYKLLAVHVAHHGVSLRW